MATPHESPHDVAFESDAMQADYFRGFLDDHRTLVAQEIETQSRALDEMSIRSDALAINRVRRHIRQREHERRDLDRMIAALDRRFAQ